MKPMDLAVLLLAFQNVRGGLLYISTASNVIQNDSPITSTFGSSHLGFQRLKRQSRCRDDQYTSADSTWCCDRCLPGTYVVGSCSNTSDYKCSPCGENEYMDTNNFLNSCHRCKSCQEGNGHKVKTKCNATHNTVCICMKNRYCEPPGSCTECLPCKLCNKETEEIEHPCAETSNTVCKAKAKKLWIFAVVVLFVAMVVGGILIWKKEALPCKRKPKSKVVKEQTPFLAKSQPKELVVPDIELTEEKLQLIAGEIEPKYYHQFGIQLGLNEPRLQQLEFDYRDDKNRQGYSILYSWLQSNGKKGAFPKLIDVLKRGENFATAENIMKKLNCTEENANEIVQVDESETSLAIVSVH